MALAIMFGLDREVDRWPNVNLLPNPKFWGNYHFLYFRWPDGETYWYQLPDQQYGWVHVNPENVPKIYRLLALLE